jgi:hypothetical protein
VTPPPSRLPRRTSLATVVTIIAMRVNPRKLRGACTWMPTHEHLVTSRLKYLYIVPLVMHIFPTSRPAMVLPPQTSAWARLSRPHPGEQSMPRLTTTPTCQHNSSTMHSRHTFQSRALEQKCGPLQGTIKPGCRCSRGHKVARISPSLVEMTGTVRTLNQCRRMAGSIQGLQRQCLHLVPREPLPPTTISRLSIPHFTPVRVTLRTVTLPPLLSFHLSITVLSPKCMVVLCQVDHTRPCNKHTLPVLLPP